MQPGRVRAVLWTEFRVPLLSHDDVRTPCQFHGLAAAVPHQLPGRIPKALSLCRGARFSVLVGSSLPTLAAPLLTLPN